MNTIMQGSGNQPQSYDHTSVHMYTEQADKHGKVPCSVIVQQVQYFLCCLQIVAWEGRCFSATDGITVG